MKKIIPIALLLIGIAAGIGTGLFLRPVSETIGQGDTSASTSRIPVSQPSGATEFVKVGNQFVVPVVSSDVVVSMIIMQVSVEVPKGKRDDVIMLEPRLRDGFLQVMFDHANAGGFDGAFTNSTKLDVLRATLLDVAKKQYDSLIRDVLITDIGRQDV